MEYDKMELFQQILMGRYAQDLEVNKKRIQHWTEYIEKYKQIIHRLEMIKSELSWDCMVPFGKLAFMIGNLVHTNEILVSIGSGHFVQYSNWQAVALCNRKIEQAEEMLKQFEQERSFLEMKQNFRIDQGAFGFDDCKDILEHCNDEELEKWRVEHRLNEQKYRKKLSKSKCLETKSLQSDDDIFQRLDELEIEEELDASQN